MDEGAGRKCWGTLGVGGASAGGIIVVLQVRQIHLRLICRVRVPAVAAARSGLLRSRRLPTPHPNKFKLCCEQNNASLDGMTQMEALIDLVLESSQTSGRHRPYAANH